MPYQNCKGCKNPIRTPFEYCGDPCRPEMFETEKAETEDVADVAMPPPSVQDETLDIG